jgi:hypothetical protein
MNHREGLVGVQVLASQVVPGRRKRGRCCNISKGTEGGPFSRGGRGCCTEEEIEAPGTIMSSGLEQRLDCDVDILYDMD